MTARGYGQGYGYEQGSGKGSGQPRATVDAYCSSGNAGSNGFRFPYTVEAKMPNDGPPPQNERSPGVRQTCSTIKRISTS